MPLSVAPFRSLPRPSASGRWLDPRAVGLALLLAMAAALPSWTTLRDRREGYFFDVTLTSTAAGMTRVAWDRGGGFNEHDSSVQPLRVETRPVSYRFLLPYGLITGLRLTPLDRAGTITLADARIVDREGRILRRFGATDMAPGHGIARFDRTGELDHVTINSGDSETFLIVHLDRPLRLPITWRALWHSVPTWAWVTLGLGLLLASVLGSVVGARGARLLEWGAARPLRSIALLAAAVVVWQAHPVVFQGRSFVSPANGSLMLYGDLPTVPGSKQTVYADGMGSDVGAMLFQHLYYPMLERTSLLHDHELPLWNRSSLGGIPLLGQGQSMFGDPFNVLTIVANGASWAWDVRFLIARWLLAMGLGVAAWQLTRHFPSAVLTTIASGFLAFFTYRLNHPVNFSVGYAPWLLVGWIALVQATSSRRRDAALALLLLAHWVEFASGTVKEAVVLIIALDLVGVLLLLFSPQSARERWSRFAGVALVAVVFVMLAAPLWWSFLDALRHSYTTSDAPQAGQLPWRGPIGLFDDIFYRQNSAEEWVVSPALNFLFFAGVVGAIVCWIVPRSSDAAAAPPGTAVRDRRLSPRSISVGPLVVVTAFCIAIGFGAIPSQWITVVPFLGQIGHIGDVFSLVLLILLPLIAAVGFRAIAVVAGERRWRIRATVAVLVAVMLLVAWWTAPTRVGISAFSLGYAAQLLIAVAVLAMGLRWRAAGVSAAAWRVTCALAVPLLLWRHGQYGSSVFNHYVFVPGERVNIHARSQAEQYLDARRAEPARVIGLGTNLFPGYAGALGWESLYGVDALRNRRYHELTTALDLQRVDHWELPDAESDIGRLQPARDALNVRWYLANPTSAARELGGLTRVAQADLDVYESETAWPRAFFCDRLARYSTVAELAELIARGDGRPFAAAQSGEADVPNIASELAGRVVRPASQYRLTTNTTRFVVDAPTQGVAVLSEAFYPADFRVVVDGQTTPYFRVNHAFKGIFIRAPGRHIIVVRYWPEHFTTALTLCAGGCVLLLAVALWRGRDLWRAYRRRSAA